jgi:crotonobetainyl-CoA:carnitine CoA-transferase CaiB-like acyl-CoA transferase
VLAVSVGPDLREAPLSGLRVLELGRSVGPAFCGKLLAEMGCDVALVEPPGGHALREAAPRATLASGKAASALFLYLAGGKRSIVVDRRDGADGAALKELVAAADLVIHDLPEREAREQGLAFADLRKLRPGIVVAAITPYGASGPYADYPASDLTVYALSGHLYLTGAEEREPLLPYGHQPAMFGGVLGAVAALASVMRARRDGVARLVEISQQEALAGALDTTLNRFTYTGATRGRYGNRLPDKTPLTDIYRTKDGFFLICVYTEVQWRGFCTMLARLDWLENPELRTLAGRLSNGAMIEAAMTAWFAARLSSEALEACQHYRLPSCIASSVPELLRDRQLMARDHFAAVEDPACGLLSYPKLPWLLSSGESREAAAPGLGEHGAEIRRSWSRRQAAPPSAAADTGVLPLAGIRVLDVTHAWAGPFAGLQLGFLGADMIKVEGARRPDGTRYVSRDARSLAPDYETGGYFHEWNRNKRSAVISMDDADGRALMHDLVRRSDVLINNYSARVLPKWGLDWPALRALNPRLVLVTMPAFGSQGPYGEFVGYGETLEGAGGLARLSGYEAGKPIRSGVAYPDPLVGYFGALAVALGLMYREQTGSGLWLDVSHQECVLHMIGDAVLHFQMTGEPQEPGGNARADLLFNEVLPCRGADDWLAVSATTPAQLQALAEATEIPELASRPADPNALESLRAWTRLRDKHAAMALLVGRGVPAGAVLKIDELVVDRHLVARDFFESVPHAVVGEKRHPRAGFRIAGATVGTRLAAPLFDAATDEILTNVLGKGAGEIGELRRRGVIGGKPAGSQLPS